MLIFNYTFSKTWDVTCYNHATYLFAITLLQVLMVKFYLLFVDSQMKFVHWPQFSEVFLSQCNVFHYRTLSVFMQCLLTQKIMDRISLWRFPLPTCLLMPPFNDMICRLQRVTNPILSFQLKSLPANYFIPNYINNQFCINLIAF